MAETDLDRITKLEIQLAHTQRTCEQLNDVVTGLTLEAQNRDRLLNRLVNQLKDLKDKLDAAGPMEEERPPHY